MSCELVGGLVVEALGRTGERSAAYSVSVVMDQGSLDRLPVTPIQRSILEYPANLIWMFLYCSKEQS